MKMLLFCTLLTITVVYANSERRDGFRLKNLGEKDILHPRHGRVGNGDIPPAYDCALRAFTIEMAA